MRIGVVFGIVAILSSEVDGIDLPNGNDLTFGPRGEGRLHKNVLGWYHNSLDTFYSIRYLNGYFYCLSSQMITIIWKNVAPLQIGSWM